MSRKRILIFSLAYHPVVGGAEIAVKEITDRISDVEFDLITMCFDKAHLSEEKIGNSKVYRIDTSKSLYPFKAFLLAKKLHKDRQYDAIWAIMANWAGLAALFFKFQFPQVLYILTLQEGDSISYIKRKVWFIYPLFKRIFLRADIIQAISNYLGEWARDMGYKGRVEVVPNGVDVGRFMIQDLGFKNKKETILITTSRLVTKNGVGDVIEAMKHLPENVKFQILGTGPLESELKHHVRILNLESRIKFLGHISNEKLPEYLHSADIFIRPSLSEGQGISFIEAMAAGLPVIATPVGGIPDFLIHEETGLFCEVKNPKSIADQVKRLIEDEPLREKLVEKAQKMVKEKYDWDLIVEQMRSRVFNAI